MKEIQKHEDLKQCAIYSYGKNHQLPAEYVYINHYENPKSGFSAFVIKNGNKVVISYCGSDDTKDWVQSNIPMFLSKMPAQSNDAIAVYEKIRQQYPHAQIILTGHSLGGSLAQIVGAVFDVETVTFNAYGTKNLINTNMTVHPDKITNYINLNDYNVITKNTHNQIGTCYSIGTRGFSINNHEAESMLPLKERKKFDQRDYGRSEGKQPKEVHTKNSSCTGSYPVSSYTKSDGTNVSGYTRSCYIHSGNVLKSYLGKAVKDMSQNEIDEILENYI